MRGERNVKLCVMFCMCIYVPFLCYIASCLTSKLLSCTSPIYQQNLVTPAFDYTVHSVCVCVCALPPIFSPQLSPHTWFSSNNIPIANISLINISFSWLQIIYYIHVSTLLLFFLLVTALYMYTHCCTDYSSLLILKPSFIRWKGWKLSLRWQIRSHSFIPLSASYMSCPWIQTLELKLHYIARRQNITYHTTFTVF
jgi:hypothetical protein